MAKVNQQATTDAMISIPTLSELAGFCGISRTNQVVPPSGHGAKADATSNRMLHSHPCCLLVYCNRHASLKRQQWGLKGLQQIMNIGSLPDTSPSFPNLPPLVHCIPSPHTSIRPLLQSSYCMSFKALHCTPNHPWRRDPFLSRFLPKVSAWMNKGVYPWSLEG